MPIEWYLIGHLEHWLIIHINDIEIPDERDENNFDNNYRTTLKGLVVCFLSNFYIVFSFYEKNFNKHI